jgi:nucleoside-diphosphate-sugar epimerase
VNPSVIFGAGNWDESSLTIFRTVQNGLRFYTSGQNGFVDARDVAQIMVRLIQSEIKNERFLCVGNNVPFKILMEKIALKLEKKPPSISTPKWLASIVWRLSWFFSIFSRKDAMLTRASSQSAYNFMTYDSSKIITQLSFSFRSIEDTIENTINGKLG